MFRGQMSLDRTHIPLLNPWPSFCIAQYFFPSSIVFHSSHGFGFETHPLPALPPLISSNPPPTNPQPLPPNLAPQPLPCNKMHDGGMSRSQPAIHCTKDWNSALPQRPPSPPACHPQRYQVTPLPIHYTNFNCSGAISFLPHLRFLLHQT